MNSNSIKQLVMYSVMGISATVLNWFAYSLFVAYMPIVFANFFSWFVTLIYAFVTNKLYVFESKNWSKDLLVKEIIGFVASRGLTGFLEVVGQPYVYAMGLNYPLFGVEGLTAKVVVCLALVIINYFCTKFIVFRPRRDESVKSA